MSYYLVKSLSIDLNNLTFTGSFASSNVRPMTYSKLSSKPFDRDEYCNSILSDKELFVLNLIESVAGGSFKFNRSVSPKYRYAFQKTFNDFQNGTLDVSLDFNWRNNTHSNDYFFDLYDSVVRNGDTSQHNVNALICLVQRFIDNLNVTFNKINGRIMIDNDKYVLDINKRGSFNFTYLNYYEGCEKYYYDDFKSLYCDFDFLHTIRPNYSFNFMPVELERTTIDNTLISRYGTNAWNVFVSLNADDMVRIIDDSYKHFMEINNLDMSTWYNSDLALIAFSLGFPNGKIQNDSTIDEIDLVGMLTPINSFINQNICECILASNLGLSSIQELVDLGLYNAKSLPLILNSRCTDLLQEVHHG